MFENILNLLERGVVALEQIAANGAQPSWVKESKCSCPPPIVPASPADVDAYEPAIGDTVEVIDPPEHPSVQEMKEADAAYLEREFLKKTLRDKGVKFKDSARTETLKKLLDATSTSTPVEEVREIQAEAAPAPAATKEDVRNALVQLSAAKGKDAALNLLKTIGGAEKLSDVPEINFGNIVAACQEACHGA